MNYEKQRKLFNMYTGLELIRYLRYSYGTKNIKIKSGKRELLSSLKMLIRFLFIKNVLMKRE